jgi:predicted nucleic acid-binding Zn ribbon protein
MTEPVLRKCPKCGKLKLQRLISGGAGVIFKGSGFYETDYKRNRRGGDSAYSADKAKDSDSGSKSKDKSETKPDAKADSKPAEKSETKPKKDSGKKKD